jgi:integrase
MAAKAGELPKTDRGWQAYLSNIRTGRQRRWLAMGGGLTICLEEGGGKTFQARIRRTGDANARRMNIGAFPAVSVFEARKRLDKAKSLAREGRDPAIEHRRKKAGVEEVHTLSALIDLYLARREQEDELQPKTVAIERTALNALRKKIGDRLLADLQPRDIASVVYAEAARLRRAGRKGRFANIMLATTKRMFKRARGWGVYTGQNPAADLTRPAKEEPRERVLFDPICYPNRQRPKLNETGAIVAATRSDDQLEEETRAAIYLGLALGLRVSEVAGVEKAALQLEAEVPTLEIGKSKTEAGVRTIPLPRQSVELLRTLLDRSDARCKYLFRARIGAKRAGHLHPESLSRAFARLCVRHGIERATFHDLRRTVITGLGELTGNDAVAKRIVGHKDETTKSTLAKHYDRSRRLKAMLAPLQQWADALDQIGESTQC